MLLGRDLPQGPRAVRVLNFEQPLYCCGDSADRQRESDEMWDRIVVFYSGLLMRCARLHTSSSIRDLWKDVQRYRGTSRVRNTHPPRITIHVGP